MVAVVNGGVRSWEWLGLLLGSVNTWRAYQTGRESLWVLISVSLSKTNVCGSTYPFGKFASVMAV